MKYQDALIAWTPGTSDVRVGRLIPEGKPDWTLSPIRYHMTGGAAYIDRRECPDKTLRDMLMFIEFHTLVVRDRVPVEAAHRAFLEIDEYRDRISPDIPGASP